MMMFDQRQSRHGQSVTETTLALALVAVVTLPAITVTGEALSPLMNGMLLAMTGGATDTSAGHAEIAGDASGVENFAVQSTRLSNSPDAVGSMLAGSSTVTVTLASGRKITLVGYPTDIAGMVESAGGNGATLQLASLLSVLTDKLAVMGEITDEQHTQMTRLANQGHEIAAIEKMIEEQSQLAVSNNMETTMVTYQGEQVPLQYLVNQIGWQNIDYAVTDPLNPTDAFPILSGFLNQYQAVRQSGVLNDPMVEAVVTSLVSEIAFLSEDVENLSVDFQNLHQRLPAEVSHRNSADICAAGLAQGNGVQCGNPVTPN
ncbi:MAG: hypothetical protein AB7P76_00680 [Candidatus Melainabacteria bacterium]